MKIVWLTRAKADLESELEYIAVNDEDMARRIATVLYEKTNQLGTFPNLGKPGRVIKTRELVIVDLPYILPYRIHGDTVEILRVFHTSRNPPKKW